MYLIQLDNGAPVGHAITFDNFRQCYPNMSLPFPLLPEHIEPLGFGIYDFSMPPEHGVFEKLVEVAPVKSPDNGVYYQTFNIEPMTEAEIADTIEKQWVRVRQERNSKLTACDWTQLPDAPVNAADWTEYRQALRDITNQDDPFDISWPTKPT